MHSSWTVLFVAVALFAVALAESPGRKVEAAYAEWIQARADGDAEAICALELRDEAPLTGEDVDECLEEQAKWLRPEAVVFWRRVAQLDIVTLKVDGDYADVSLRSGDCTLTTFDAIFQRLENGEWRYRQGSPWWPESAPTCHEHYGVPARDTPGIPWPPQRWG